MNSSLPRRLAGPLCALLVASALAAQEPPPASAPAPAAPAATASPSATAPASGSAAATAPAEGSAATAPATTSPAASDAQSATATPAAPATHPQLVAAELVHDAGRVRKGEKLGVEFALENHGDGDLQIRTVQTSCGCTVASFDRTIKPGGKGRVHAWVDTSNFVGDIAKYLTVESNDPVTPRLQLTIKADVVAFVTASPSYARILQVQGQAASTTSVELWADGEPPLEVTGVDAPKKWIEASARRAAGKDLSPAGPPEQWRLDVTVHPDAPVGPLDETLVVHTNNPHQKRLELPLTGFVRPVVQAVPEAADFGTLGEAADQHRFVLKLFNFGSDPVEVTGVSSSLAFVTTKVEPDEAGRRYRIELDLAPDAPKGKFDGKLEITTSSKAVPQLTVPVRGRVG